MVVRNGEPDIRLGRRVATMGIVSVLLTATLVPVAYTSANDAHASGLLDTVLWMAVGVIGAVIMFIGVSCILHDRFRRMRRDRNYWAYLCNEYRAGRGQRLERVWHGLKATDEIKTMDAVEAELSECWKKSC